jgi:hypothetical protein
MFARALLDECLALPERRQAEVTGVVVHRIEVSQEDPSFRDTPADVARFFREHPVGKQATGGAMPYPLLIDAQGQITQTVPLLRVTPHARKYNPTTVGVALLGDFRGKAPSELQRRACVLVCADLLHALGRTSADMFGHDELSGGSSDPDKECPGRHLPMSTLRQDVAAELARGGGRFELSW